MILLICCKKIIGGCLKFGEGGWLHHFFIKSFFYSRHLRLVLSRKTKVLFLPCCFVSGTRPSFEFISDSSFSLKLCR